MTALVFGAAGLVGTAGCQAAGDSSGSAGVAAAARQQQAVSKVSEASAVMEPADGADKVRPDAQIVVRAKNGTLADVSVSGTDGTVLAGSLNADRTAWTSDGLLTLSTRYIASARAVDAKNRSTTTMTTFSTLTPSKILKTSISPLNGSTVGVGMPIIVRFNAPVENRAAVEETLKVSSTPDVVGAWYWMGDQEVHWRPKEYWPAHTAVSLHVGLAGVDAGDGVWGQKDRTVKFATGAATVSVVDVRAKRMTVRRDGKVIRTIPVTTGKAGFLTRNGTKVVIEKFRTKVMDAATLNVSRDDPDYYRIDNVPYALRVTFSGEFVHGAPWSVGSQGRANVSHGCVGMSVADAKWLFGQSRVGDIVQVVGSPRHLESGNGWTDWNVPWSTWLSGSALS
jgi:lipoprotein-anchoring transpeptidase ErfK/SrfK